MFTLLIFILVLSVLVFVHELGHFWTARKFGAGVEEFGFGFPPRAIGYYKSKDGKWRTVRGSKEVDDAADTIYSLNWIPIGGFVKIKGENGEDQNDPDSFASKKIWQRATILLAGVTMNVLLAAVLISIGFMIGLPQAVETAAPGAVVSDQQIQIIDVSPESPAAEAGLQTGDIIESIDGREFTSINELQEYVGGNVGEPLEYNIQRADQEIVKELTPVARDELDGRGGVGIGVVETGTVKYPFFRAVWEGLKTTVFLTWAILVAFYELIKSLVTGGGVSADLAGPVGIATLTGQVARMGFVYLLQFTALLSINLAIINALPFPALDGGRLLFLGIEKIKGRPVRREVEGVIHYIGFALLMVLIVLVTFRDIGRSTDFFSNLWDKIAG